MQSKKRLYLATAISVALLTGTAAFGADTGSNPVRFLTGAQLGEPQSIALGYLESQRAALSLTDTDVSEMELRDNYRSDRSGIQHMYWRQHHQGIEVYNGILAINVARDGSVINLNNGFVSNLAAKVNTTTPSVDAADAITAAADDLQLLNRAPLLLLREEGGASSKAVYSNGGISQDEIPVQLVYQPSADGSSARLAWDMVIRETGGHNWWSLRVDAETSEVIDHTNFIAHSGPSAAPKGSGTDASYRVFPFPFESPDETPHLLVSDPHDVTASPFGWHDTNGVAGPEFTDTRGNNVIAQDDLDGNNSGGSRPSSTGSNPQVFDFAFDPAMDPEVGNNLNAAIVNLFYWNNIMHDVTYQYGFDEPSGNFQTNNYGNGGSGNDEVLADALDQMLGGPNGPQNGNANFGTPGDGFSPRMQMFRFLAPVELVANTPPGIAGSYSGSGANFGPIFDQTGQSGDLQLVDDGTAPNGDSCEPSPAGSLAGQIAILDRGGCEFGVKVLNAENAGAVAAVVVNNDAANPDATIGMGPGVSGGAVTIRSMMVSLNDGTLIKGQLPSPGVNITMRSTLPHRDSDMDAGVIAHEYGHGISNRLTGGPSAAGCLGNGEQGGEGWSDFWALVLHAKASDTAATPRFLATYAQFDDRATGPGFRNFPFSNDPAVNPETYADVGTTNAPHGVGEIWVGALWNVYWNLVDQYGFDPDLYAGTGGNNLLIQLVMDGMKLQPCSPTMVQARDAILLADMNNNAGANQCPIWSGFAAKGMGVNADAGTGAAGDEVENFEVPLVCDANVILIDGFE